MNDETERSLVACLAEHAGPAVDTQTLAANARRRGAVLRRQRVAAVGAGLAVVAVVATGLVGVTWLGGEPVPLATRVAEAPATWSGIVPDFEDLKEPHEVWPDAVHRLPTTLPDGSSYEVMARLDDGRYLVQVAGRMNPRGPAPPTAAVGPMVLDSKARTVRPLGDLVAAGTDGTRLEDAAVVGDSAVWVLRQGASRREVWSALLDGTTKARRIATWTGPGVAYPIGVHGGAVYWAPEINAAATGIYRMPLSGGMSPERVPGSEGFRDVGQFPWATTAHPETALGSVAEPDQPEQRSGELLNVVTGERRSWTANPEAAAVTCNPVLCVGRSAPDNAYRYAVLQRLDGSGLTKLPYHYTDLTHEESALDGRFGVATVQRPPDDPSWIWDRATGAAARVHGQSLHLWHRLFPSTVVQWRQDDATYVLDLTAIK